MSRLAAWYSLTLLLLQPAQCMALNFSFSPLSDESTTLPGSSELVSTIGEMAIDGDTTYFIATGADGNQGIYSSEDGQLNAVFDLATQVPGATSNFSKFSDFVVEDGNFLFIGGSRGFDSREGIYTNVGGSLRTVIDTNTPMPGTSGNFRSIFGGLFDKPRLAISGQEVAFTAGGPFFNGFSREGVYRDAGNGLEVIADFRTSHPDPTKEFLTFDNVDIRDGEVVFRAGANDFVSAGLFTNAGAPPGEVVALADQDSPFDQLVGRMRLSQNASIHYDGNRIISHVADDNSNDAIYAYGDGQLDQLVNSFSEDPVSLENLGDIGGIFSVDSGTVAFQTFGSSIFAENIYLHRNSRVHRVIGVGDELDGNEISNLRIYRDSLAGDKLVFRTEFADSSIAIYEAQFSRPSSETFPIFSDFDVHAITGENAELVDGGATVDVQGAADIPDLNLHIPERRVIMDFPLSHIPEDATIESVVLQLKFAGAVSNPTIEVFGYAGDGVPDLEDMDAGMYSLGTFGPIASFGDVNLELDRDLFDSLRATSEYLGLVIVSEDGRLYAFSATEERTVAPPVLMATVTYDETMPGDFDFDGDVDGSDFLAWQTGDLDVDDLAAWRSNYVTTNGLPGDFDGDASVNGSDFLAWQLGNSPNAGSQQDLADWQTNYGNHALVATAAVPEPGTCMLVCVFISTAGLTNVQRSAPRRVPTR